MTFSLPGLIGCFMGIVIGVMNYGVLIAVVEKRLRSLDRAQTPAERGDFERRIMLMRRIVLASDIVLFGAIGYWFGATIGGAA